MAEILHFEIQGQTNTQTHKHTNTQTNRHEKFTKSAVKSSWNRFERTLLKITHLASTI